MRAKLCLAMRVRGRGVAQAASNRSWTLGHTAFSLVVWEPTACHTSHLHSSSLDDFTHQLAILSLAIKPTRDSPHPSLGCSCLLRATAGMEGCSLARAKSASQDASSLKFKPWKTKCMRSRSGVQDGPPNMERTGFRSFFRTNQQCDLEQGT